MMKYLVYFNIIFVSIVNGLSISSSSSTTFLRPSSINSFLVQSTTVTTTCDSHHSSSSHRSFLDMKVSKGKSKQKRSKGSQIAISNDKRLRQAGRKGTKNFVDPNKVFVGNLSFQATEDDVKEFLSENGVSNLSYSSVKIIRDWKTHESKGFGFIQFVEPIYATSALEMIRGRKLLGRVVRLDQGKRKKPDPLLLVKNKAGKNKKESKMDDDMPIEERESLVISDVLDAIDSVSDTTFGSSEADEDDNIDEEEDEQALQDGFYSDPGFDLDDALLFSDDFDDEDDDEDEDEFEYDGVYVEEYLEDEDADDDDKPMNRAQRRDAAKRKKKRIKPGRGFGNMTPSTN